jgi:serine/threonine protein kinase
VNGKIDIWALGIVLYNMSVGYKPTAIKKYKYGDGPIPFHRGGWEERSPEVQDLTRKMLEFDPEKRISAREALEHLWFQSEKE